MRDPKYAYRKAKHTALVDILRPAGFEKGKEMLVRQAGGQLHGIEFQTSKNGGKYFVNIAFSYDFVPSSSALFMDSSPPPRNFHLLDFLLYSRIGSFLPRPYQDSWTYDDLDASSIVEQVSENARIAVQIIDGFANKWADPTTFLTLVPPNLLMRDREMRLERYEAEQKNLPWRDRPFPLNEAFGEEWRRDHFHLACALAMIAKRFRKRELSEGYVKVAETIVDPLEMAGLEKLRALVAAENESEGIA